MSSESVSVYAVTTELEKDDLKFLFMKKLRSIITGYVNIIMSVPGFAIGLVSHL